MALFTDGNRLLVFSDVDFGFFAVDFNLVNLGRGKGLANKFGSVVTPSDNIDFLFVADFVHYSANADTAATDEGAYWVDTWDARDNSDFGAATRFASNSFDLDGAVVDFGDFLTE